MPQNARRFTFDGGAATYFGTAILAVLVTVCTLGVCYPFAVVLRERWRAKHSYIDGQPLVFIGSALGLFGLWIKWFLLIVITLGIYSFWVGPRIARWKWENTEFASVTGLAASTAPYSCPPRLPAFTTTSRPRPTSFTDTRDDSSGGDAPGSASGEARVQHPRDVSPADPAGEGRSA